MFIFWFRVDTDDTVQKRGLSIFHDEICFVIAMKCSFPKPFPTVCFSLKWYPRSPPVTASLCLVFVSTLHPTFFGFMTVRCQPCQNSAMICSRGLWFNSRDQSIAYLIISVYLCNGTFTIIFPKRHVFDLEIPLISWMFHTSSYICFNSLSHISSCTLFFASQVGSRVETVVSGEEEGERCRNWLEGSLALLEWPFDICYPKQIRNVWWMTMTGLWSILSVTTYKHDGPACASKPGSLFWELKVGQFHPISAFGWVTVLKWLAHWQAFPKDSTSSCI